MNYYVYCNDQHVRSFHTEGAARAWVSELIAANLRAGAKGHPAYKLCYNGSESVTITTWERRTFKP